MLFKVFNEMFNRFNNLRIGAIILTDINNSDYNIKVEDMLKEVSNLIKLEFTKEDLTKKSKNPKAKLISAWQSLYYKLGHADEEKDTGIDTLIKNAINGRELNKINMLGDLCRYVSLKYIIPVNAFNLDKINGDIFLGLASGEERFNDNEFVPEKEVIYFDSDGALSRNWNRIISKKAKVEPETKNVIIFLDALEIVDQAVLESIFTEFEKLNGLFLHGKIYKFILDRKIQELRF